MAAFRFPVCYSSPKRRTYAQYSLPQDCFSTLDLRSQTNKIHPSAASSLLSLSYLQFEQLLVRLSRKLPNKRGLQSLLETIQTYVASEYRVRFFLASSREKEEDSAPLQTVQCWSEESLTLDYQISPRGTTFAATPQPKMPHASVFLSSVSLKNQQPKRIRKLGSELYGGPQECSLVTPTHRTQVSKLDCDSQGTVAKIAKLVDDFRGQWEELTEKDARRKTEMPAQTALRKTQELAFRVKNDGFSKGFVKKLLFDVWRLRAQEGANRQ